MLDNTLVQETMTAFSQTDYFLIAACREFETAYAMKGDVHSVFTTALLRGLREKKNDRGQVTTGSLFDFVYEQMRGLGQEPMYLGLGRSLSVVSYPPEVQRERVVNETNRHESFSPYSRKWDSLLKRNSNNIRLALILFSVSIPILVIGLTWLTPGDELSAYILCFLVSILISTSIFLASKVIQINGINIDKLFYRVFIASITFLGTIYICLRLVPHAKIITQAFTGVTEFPVLSIVNESFPKSLGDILGFKQNPVIDTQTPAYQAIQRFKEETGGSNFISRVFSNDRELASVSAEINNKNFTSKYLLPKGNISGTAQKNGQTPQFQSDFEKDGRIREGFKYASIFTGFQDSKEEAEWTSILRNGDYESFYLMQFPKLSKFSLIGNTTRELSNEWVYKILKANAEIRGVFGLLHGYEKTSKRETSFKQLIARCGLPSIYQFIPNPYVRFVDIRNNTSLPAKIESLTQQLLKRDDYQLTPIPDDRGKLFENIAPSTESINLTLNPGQDILIPIEFGLETRGFKEQFKNLLTDTRKSDFLNQISEPIFFAKPLDSAPVTNFKINQIPDKVGFVPIKLSQEFVSDTQKKGMIYKKILTIDSQFLQ